MTGRGELRSCPAAETPDDPLSLRQPPRLSLRLSPRHRLGAALLALAAVGVAPVVAMRADAPSAEPETATPARVAAATTLVGVPRAPAAFTGYAFDACQAPRQDRMDTWLEHSPYRGVGVYIAGANRLCKVQKHLDAAWVAEQTRKGWHLLPLTVGRQAACTHVDHWKKISARPAHDYARARRQGTAEAAGTARAATALGIAGGTTMWLDMEIFDLTAPRCRDSTLAFVSGWTDRLHELGFRSGYYSGGSSGMRVLEAARRDPARRYSVPDDVWVADWNGRDGDLSGDVTAGGWARGRIVHQYTGSHVESHGGVRIEVDSNFVALGPLTVPDGDRPGCGLPRDYGAYRLLARGRSDLQVATAQCLLKESGSSESPVTGSFDGATEQAVRAFQHARRLPVTGRVDRRTWAALLAHGSTPRLRLGARSDAVRRVQRGLNAVAGAGLAVDGEFGHATRAAVRRYQHRLHLHPSGAVNRRVWASLQTGRR